MPHCAAFGCSFQSKGNKGSDVSFHSFPSDKKRREVWENACGRVQLSKDPRLCPCHFTPDSFESFSQPQLLKELMGSAGFKRRLKPNAVPMIFSHKKSKRPRTASENVLTGVKDRRCWTLSCWDVNKPLRQQQQPLRAKQRTPLWTWQWMWKSLTIHQCSQVSNA